MEQRHRSQHTIHTRANQTEISVADVTKRIYTLRGTQVMIDSDLAKIYGIQNYNLKKAVRRNLKRFPGDFCYEASKEELQSLIFQAGRPNSESVSESARTTILSEIPESQAFDELQDDTLMFQLGIPNLPKENRGGSRYLPFVFTEQGVAQLSTVLHTDRAIQISIGIMRRFVQLRTRWMQNQIDLVPKLELLQNGITQIQQRLNQVGAKVNISALPSSASQELSKAALVQRAVEGHFGLTSDDLKSASRMQPISLARQIAIFFMKKHLGMGFSEIGRHLGGRDHSTILHAYRKIHVDSEDNATVRKAVMTLLNEIQPLLV